MKLSALKALVADMEANVIPENPDPTVEFWVVRDLIEEPTERDSQHFLQFSLETNKAPVGAKYHQVWKSPDNMKMMASAGDFHLPAVPVPVYR